jgi:hypothetical protein
VGSSLPSLLLLIFIFQEDEALFDSEKENAAKYKAIVVRVGEKRILKGTIGEAMKGLTNESKNNKKRLMESDAVVKSSKKIKSR